MKRTRTSTALVIVFLISFLASASAFTETINLPPFIRDNLPGFSTSRLSNGIPVYVKRTTANRVRNLSLVILGGSLTAEPREAGWSKTALATMARASSSYPYKTVVDLLDATSSSISSSAQFEYSTFSLNVLDKYFDRLFPVWADMIIAPSFAKSDFEQVQSEVILAIQSKDENPWAITGRVMNETFFAGHPYATVPDGTEATVQAATSQAMKSWYAANISADRVFIVAVGDFEPEALTSSLNATLGTLPDRKLGPVGLAPSFASKKPGGLITEENDQSRGVAYLRGDFPAPASREPAYMAVNIAMKLFSDLLFSVVRDKYGAVYTPSSAIRSFGANYGSISMYKTTKAESIKSYIDEAASIFASGRCVSVDPSRPGEESAFMKISDALDTYKRLYSNEYFAAIRTNAAVAGLMIRSVVASDDPADWLYDVQRIAEVTPDQVSAAFSAYVLGGPFTWVAVGDPKLLARFDPDSFAGFNIAK